MTRIGSRLPMVTTTIPLGATLPTKLDNGAAASQLPLYTGIRDSPVKRDPSARQQVTLITDAGTTRNPGKQRCELLATKHPECHGYPRAGTAQPRTPAVSARHRCRTRWAMCVVFGESPIRPYAPTISARVRCLSWTSPSSSSRRRRIAPSMLIQDDWRTTPSIRRRRLSTTRMT